MKSFIVDLVDNIKLLENLVKAYNENTNGPKAELSPEQLEKIVIARIDDHLQWNLVWASRRFFFKDELEKALPWFKWDKSNRRTNRFYEWVIVPYEDMTVDLGDMIDVDKWDIPYIVKAHPNNPTSKTYIIGSYGDYRVAEWERIMGKDKEVTLRRQRQSEFDGFSYKALFRMEFNEKMKMKDKGKAPPLFQPSPRQKEKEVSPPSARVEDLSLYEAIRLDTIIKNK